MIRMRERRTAVRRYLKHDSIVKILTRDIGRNDIQMSFSAIQRFFFCELGTQGQMGEKFHVFLD